MRAQELVQVESLAQVGVQLLLFTLGLEFSVAKLRAVRSVALVGGVMQILLTMVLAGGLASAIGASIHEGVFIGALVSMAAPTDKCIHSSVLLLSIFNKRSCHFRLAPKCTCTRCL